MRRRKAAYVQLQAAAEEASAQAKRKAAEEAQIAEQRRRAELEAKELAKRSAEEEELRKAKLLHSLAKRMKKKKAKRARDESKKGKVHSLIAEREERNLVKLVEEAQRALRQNRVEEVSKTNTSESKRPEREEQRPKSPSLQTESLKKTQEVLDHENTSEAELRRILAKRMKKEKEKLAKKNGADVVRELMEHRDIRLSVSFLVIWQFEMKNRLLNCFKERLEINVTFIS